MVWPAAQGTGSSPEVVLLDVGPDTQPERVTAATHASECNVDGASGGDGEEELDAENVSPNEAALEDDSEVTDIPDSHVADPDSPVEKVLALMLPVQKTGMQIVRGDFFDILSGQRDILPTTYL